MLCNFKIKYMINWLNCNALCNRAACLIRASACNAVRIFQALALYNNTRYEHWHINHYIEIDPDTVLRALSTFQISQNRNKIGQNHRLAEIEWNAFQELSN